MSQSTTSHYMEYGTLPTMTEEQKQRVLSEPYVLPEAEEETLGGVRKAQNVAESSATSVAGLKETVNALLSALKDAGIMTEDEESSET